MKKLFVILLVFCFGLAVVSSCVFGAFSSAISGKTMLGINYMTWGTFTGITAETGSITSGLTTIRAFGVNVNTGEAFAADGSSEVFATAQRGTLQLKSADTTARGGTWFVIGR